MRAFSYAWSLPVMWQRWRSHHWIRRTRKAENPTLHANITALCLIEQQLLTIEVLHCANRNFWTFLAPVTLTLTRWPSYTKSTWRPWRYIHRMCKYELPTSRLSTVIVWQIYTQNTDRTKSITHAASLVVMMHMILWNLWNNFVALYGCDVRLELLIDVVANCSCSYSFLRLENALAHSIRWRLLDLQRCFV